MSSSTFSAADASALVAAAGDTEGEEVAWVHRELIIKRLNPLTLIIIQYPPPHVIHDDL